MLDPDALDAVDAAVVLHHEGGVARARRIEGDVVRALVAVDQFPDRVNPTMRLDVAVFFNKGTIS